MLLYCHGRDRKLAAILAADVVGFSRPPDRRAKLASRDRRKEGPGRQRSAFEIADASAQEDRAFQAQQTRPMFTNLGRK